MSTQRRRFRGALCLLFFTAGSAGAQVIIEDPIPGQIPTGQEVSLETVASGFAAPLWATHANDGKRRLFVVDQIGILWDVSLADGSKTVFLDLGLALVSLGQTDERGFLGVAFHPGYATNGLFYTYTSDSGLLLVDPPDFPSPGGGNTDHQSVIREWLVEDPQDPDSEKSLNRIVMQIAQPQNNHNGGAITFGPDGMLYIALGDGGSGNDAGSGHSAQGNGQDPTNVLGSILRIDVDGRTSTNGEYGIPADNPFVSGPELDEIWAYGLRNPYRIGFDTLTGDLYIGDVGQRDIEEVSLGASGANFGWRVKEGTFCFDASRTGVFDCGPNPPQGMTDPIVQYDHDEGVSVIGGFVYRARRHPDLEGLYIFGELRGRLLYLDIEEMGGPVMREFVVPGLVRRVLGFGQDALGNVYVLGNDLARTTGTSGVVQRIVPEPGAEALSAAALATLCALARRARLRPVAGRPRSRLCA